MGPSFFLKLKISCMKVKFLKNHLDNKKGDVADVTKERANYWQLVGVAETTDAASKPAKKGKTPKTKKTK